MREALSPYVGKRIAFSARMKRYGASPAGNPTILFTGLCLKSTGELLTEHIWVKQHPRIERAGVRPGDDITFTATVHEYQRLSGEWDYCIKNLRAILRAAS